MRDHESTPSNTIAARFAARFGNDGTSWVAPDSGESFVEVIRQLGCRLYRAHLKPCEACPNPELNVFRFKFADESAIISDGDTWGLEDEWRPRSCGKWTACYPNARCDSTPDAKKPTGGNTVGF